jgi:lysophospholipase L1-like esterase
MSLKKWQRKYLFGATALLPVSPFLYLQGQYARLKIGVLPDARGEKTGIIGEGTDPVSLFVIGESTVAGLGARSHEYALAGQFALQLHRRIERPVEWSVVGKSGVTARRTIRELLPQMPQRSFDHILIGLGGNDVLKLSSPKRWRNDMTELLDILRSRSPNAAIFLANCPMIKLSPALPEPIRSILWELSKLHDENIHDLTRSMDRVFYYPQPRDLVIEGFFADGIHPSEKGYSDWAAAMMEYFDTNHRWQISKR